MRRIGGGAAVGAAVLGGVARRPARRDGHCCEACAVGAPCGSLVPSAAPLRAAGFDWRGAPQVREEVITLGEGPRSAAPRAAGDPPSCVRRDGESVTAYRSRCGLDRTGMDSELWQSMNAAERRRYLDDVTREAGLSAREEQRVVSQAISGGFDTLREVIRTIRDVRIQEIRSGAAVQIASIRGLSETERRFLEDWDRNTTTTTTTGGTTTTTGGASGGSSMGAVPTLGLLAVAAKLAGLW